jgi:hypothetical protein
METISAPRVLAEEEADALAGTLLGPDSYDRVVRDDCIVLRPDGSPLLVLRRNALPAAACAAAFPALRPAANDTRNRGMAAGPVVEPAGDPARAVRAESGIRFFPIKRDGTLSRTNQAGTVQSGIVGYFDRSARHPYCRQTAFNANHPGRFAAAVPLFRAADRVFAESVPDRHAAQMAYVRRTSPDFVIPGTSFTTVTVNLNWQTAVHKDIGDLPAGFGVMTVLRAGSYSGCFLCFPAYRLAVDLRTRDVLLADVHEWHGNTPFTGVPGSFVRLSLVLYYRSRMAECGTAAEELALVKRRRPGQPIHG